MNISERHMRAASDTSPPPERRKAKPRYWDARDLAVIGIFAALTKVSSLMVALIGGGMNPLTLALKNLVFTTLLIVLLFKVRKPGTLILFIVINTIFSMLLMGGGFFLLPPMLLAGLCAEGVILLFGGYTRNINIVIGTAMYDLLFKISSIGVSWLFIREQPEMIWITIIMVGIGYTGAIAGLFMGLKFIKELRHAGIVQH